MEVQGPPTEVTVSVAGVPEPSEPGALCAPVNRLRWGRGAHGPSARVAPLRLDHGEAPGLTFDHRNRAHGFALVGDRDTTDRCRVQNGVLINELRACTFRRGGASSILSEFRIRTPTPVARTVASRTTNTKSPDDGRAQPRRIGAEGAQPVVFPPSAAVTSEEFRGSGLQMRTEPSEWPK